MRIFGKGFNFAQDGPGNRFVYHLSGCNMRCLWCSNADGMDMAAGKEYSVEEVIKEALSCRPMFFSGGGVTFTGGEATLQAEELIKVLKALKKEGVHTCLETNATSKRLAEISEFVDYFIMDFKHFDSVVLKEYTGVGNETIKENFEALNKLRNQLHIRIPLINGVNAKNPQGFAEYFAKYSSPNTVYEFLLYHEYGKEKWQGEYKIKDGFVSKETLKSFVDTFEAFGLKTITT
ncbi:MAG: radical SAM protein [Clostridia bacterium]|nr:radical SAM protein [Clostridia bacterium]